MDSNSFTRGLGRRLVVGFRMITGEGVREKCLVRR